MAYGKFHLDIEHYCFDGLLNDKKLNDDVCGIQNNQNSLFSETTQYDSTTHSNEQTHRVKLLIQNTHSISQKSIHTQF